MAKRHEVEFQKNCVTLNGAKYSLEGVGADTVWRLAYEGLIARLKRSTDPAGAMTAISEGGLLRYSKKVEPIVEAMAQTQGWPIEYAAKIWETCDREKKAQIRRHPRIVDAMAPNPVPLDDLLGQKDPS